MTNRPSRLVAVVGIVALALGFWVPPEHIHHAEDSAHGAVIHRHVEAHALAHDAGPNFVDDDGEQTLDDVWIVPTRAIPTAVAFQVVERILATTPALFDSQRPEQFVAIHDPPRFSLLPFRAPPVLS